MSHSFFNVHSFTECMRPVMSEVTSFFKSPDNHLQDFPWTLQTIYETEIKDKCAPRTIASKAKYDIKQPIVASSHNQICPSATREEYDPVINAARLSPGSVSQRDGYKPTRCKVCGHTQKEIHEMMWKIHDPSDPQKCCFRGPKFIEDKHMRESIMQYNLKNPGQHRRNDKESTPTNNDVPPQRAHLPDPKVNQMMMDQHLPSTEEPQD